LAGQAVATTPTLPAKVQAIAFSPNGRLFATAGGEGKVQVWDLQGALVSTFKAHPTWISQVYFTSDSQHLIAIAPGLSSGSTVQRWSLEGQLVETVHQGQFRDGSHFSDLASHTFTNSTHNRFVSVFDSKAFLWGLDGEIATLEGRPTPPDFVSLLLNCFTQLRNLVIGGDRLFITLQVNQQIALIITVGTESLIILWTLFQADGDRT